MRSIKIILCFIAFAFIALSTDSAAQSTPHNVIRVGVTHCEDHLDHREITADFLAVVEATLAEGQQMQLDYLDVNEIESRVRAGTLDIFLANSGVYRSLIQLGVKDLATAVTNRTPNPNLGDGAVWFTKTERSDIQSIADLKGKSISAKAENSLAGWYFALGELKRQGLEPEGFFSHVNFVGWDTEEIIESVLDDTTDGGAVPACFIEEYVAKHPQAEGKLRILDGRRVEGVPCTLSSNLYPNWTVTITPTMPLDIAKAIAAALLSQNQTSEGIAWGVATKFDDVDAVFKALKAGPYSYLREWSLKRFVDEYLFPIVLVLAGIFGLIFYALAANRLIKFRTRQLAEAVRRQSQWKDEYQSAQRNLEMWQRVGMLNQVASILAHELRQPIGAINYYAHGLSRLIENGKADDSKTLKIVGEMGQKACFANEIISRIRTFAKKGSEPRPCSLARLVRNSADSFLLSSQNSAHISLDIPEDIQVEVDPFEIELVILNLLRNSSEALEKTADARIWIAAESDQEKVFLTVRDNGPKLSQDDLQRLEQVFQTSKVEGMGMGLAMVREVLINYGGSIRFSACPTGGLSVEITLPRLTGNRSDAN